MSVRILHGDFSDAYDYEILKEYGSFKKDTVIRVRDASTRFAFRTWALGGDYKEMRILPIINCIREIAIPYAVTHLHDRPSRYY